MIDRDGCFSPNLTGPRWDTIEVPFCGFVHLGNATMFAMYIDIVKVGTPYVEGPMMKMLVAIEKVGAFGFAISNDWLHYEYVAEKLRLPEDDARHLADWLNTIRGSGGTHNEQGDYRHLDGN